MTEINKSNDKCIDCGTTDDLRSKHPWNDVSYCEKCWEKEVQRCEEAREREEREARQLRHDHIFNERCPKTMQQLDRDHFPSDLDTYDAIMSAPLTDKGIIILGITGAGKSRTMWQLAKRLITQDHRYVEILEDCRFGRMIECSYDNGMSGHDKLIDNFQRAEVLMIDDLGKAKMTARVETDLFAIIDYRYAEGSPTVITTQFIGETLLRRFACKETGAAIVRRIKEVNDGFCLAVPA